MASRACKPATIFESKTVDIQHCPDCKMVHLTMGSITVRMSEHHFSEFAKDLSRGLFEFNTTINEQPSLRVMM
ncbi:MAG: hypothetical protein CMH22_08750 [Methylophaga sp.]|uniref:hypothetical protein n=1 Tax=Methylophaga sp. UBA678 TaxID=1946901 RepID=UPI000C67C117|nr:hypothetical protein [Methylophaga sp. UBA678]MAX52058.1 hypothetical protein [Methylophaga sp.]|tara:strand:- start:30795 stop:31013 length:219 start_codon:yes stop_codon:yes gene_type:complete